MTEPVRMVPIEEATTWLGLMAPHIARYEVAAQFGMNAVYNSKGSAAMAFLIRKMATLLDEDVERRNAPLPHRALAASGVTETPAGDGE